MTFEVNDRPGGRPPKLRGSHLAIVVENKDGDGNPGYRVKIIYPWLNDQEKSYWARIAVPMGGSDRGTYFLPEPGDQVLVVFEHGDINRPIVIGTLWSKKQEPVEVNESGKNNTKLIKSRAGHRVIFDDTEGAEKITIVDKTKKNKIVLDAVEKVVKIESDGDLVIKSAANVVIHGNALKIGISGKLTSKGQQVLSHAASTFGIKASDKVVVDGSSVTINLSNSPAAQVSGSGTGFLAGVTPEAPKEQQQEARGTSGGGAGGAATRGPGGSQSAPPPKTEEDKTHFIEISLLEADGTPAKGERYRIRSSDGQVKEGMLDASGTARIEKIADGPCEITFPKLNENKRART